MKIKELHKKIVEIQTEYKKSIEPLREKCSQFKIISAKIPHGEYEGRWGKVSNINLFDGEIRALIRPYRLIGDRSDVLNDRLDARTFWKLSDIKEIKKEGD